MEEKAWGGPKHEPMVSFHFRCEVSKLYVRTHVRESVRCEGRGGVCVGECECHTPKGTWSG
jgi:hypothetical protein